MAAHLYGIRNCDTMKKAWSWLDAHGVAYVLHDYKKEGVDAARLQAWVDQLGWEVLLNRAGTTFRKLPDSQRTGLDRDMALALMLDQPSMIKRPVLEAVGTVQVGFRAAAYQALFAPT